MPKTLGIFVTKQCEEIKQTVPDTILHLTRFHLVMHNLFLIIYSREVEKLMTEFSFFGGGG